MPIVTSIKPQKNNKRVNIYLDGKFGFGLDLENFVKEKIKVEQELTEKQVEDIVKKAELAKTKDKLLRFVMTRPRSEKEVDDWFWRKKVHASLHQKLKKFLQKYDYLNDEKFTRWWVEQRLTFKNSSKRQLIAELRQKGIEKNIIEDVLEESDIDDAKAAKKLIDKNMYKWKRYEGFEKKKKMSEFLGRKGFGWDTIKAVTHVD